MMPSVSGILYAKTSCFCDQIMSGEDQILGGFSDAGRCIDISTVESCGLAGYKASSIICLAGNLIGCRQVNDHIGTSHSMADTGRIRNPEILTDLYTDAKFLHTVTLEDKVRAHFRLLPGNLHFHRSTETGCELSSLIEFMIVGQIGLRNQAQNSATVYGCCDIVEFSFITIGKSQEEDAVEFFRKVGTLL